MIAALLGIPASALSAAMLVIRLAPAVRDAVVELIKSFDDDDEHGTASRRAYEAARRAAFIARNSGARKR